MPTAPDITTCDWPGRPELTRRIIGYLAANPEARRWAYYLGTNLCSEFGRKSHAMRKLTEHIFRNDIVHKEAYLKKPKVFEKRANSYLRQ
ncbi:hypothetical protein SISNIDRAFT_250325 [Sistotremastrum niveocremeum HHB9708]|uniref:Uncharacterized protein n=1 Tax=Sistotremastrum niveocremeum HHB9708 TaxID=1314777 RepID=A0A164YX64_9AGAM|nr:hypothetical protein SISNIDRAFT_250325 [Sistotremastrum niveocremeum HHB9708]